MFSDVKKRCVQFVVKSAIGRFVKEVSKKHLKDPAMTWEGLSFELHNLEINEDVINKECLGPDSQLRLVCGSIGSLKGEVLWTLSEPRNLDIDGLDLTFDVLGNLRPKSAEDLVKEKAHKQAAAAAAAKQKSNKKKGEGGNLYSSMLAGELTEEMVEKELLEDNQATQQQQQQNQKHHHEEADIDEGVTVLSAVIKSLVHNTCGTVSQITIRFRIPPPGKEILPGQPLPDNTVEMLVHLPQVNIADETDVRNSIGNSFRKKITCTGLIVQLYDANKEEERDRKEEEEAGGKKKEKDSSGSSSVSFPTPQRVQRLRMENTVISGDLQNVKNEIIVQFFDVSDGRGNGGEMTTATSSSSSIGSGGLPPPPSGPQQQRWKVDVNIGQVHALLTPVQLTRLLMLVDVLTRAPEARDRENNGGGGSSAGSSNSSSPSSSLEANGQAADNLTSAAMQYRNAAATVGAAMGGGNAEAPPADMPTRLKIDCAVLSCALLQSDTPDVVRNCWKQLRDGQDIFHALSTPHYSVSVDRLMVLTVTPIEQRLINPDDPFAKVFERFGGRHLSIAARNINIAEKQPNSERVPLLRLVAREQQTATTTTTTSSSSAAPSPNPGGRSSSSGSGTPNQQQGGTGGGGGGGGGGRHYQIAMTVSTTCPIAPALARQCGLMPDDFTKNIVHQAVHVSVRSPIEVFADVLMLDRLLFFYKNVSDMYALACWSGAGAGGGAKKPGSAGTQNNQGGNNPLQNNTGGGGGGVKPSILGEVTPPNGDALGSAPSSPIRPVAGSRISPNAAQKLRERGPPRFESQSTIELADLDGLRPIPDEELQSPNISTQGSGGGGTHSGSSSSVPKFPNTTGSGASTPKATTTQHNNNSSTSAVERVPYVIYQTKTLELVQLVVEALFPVERKPNVDFYGPNTQELFKKLLASQEEEEEVPRRDEGQEEATTTTTTATTTTTSSTKRKRQQQQQQHLRKTLVFDVSNLLIEIPSGAATLISTQVEKISLSLRDTVTGERDFLAKVTFMHDVMHPSFQASLRDSVIPCAVSARDHFKVTEPDHVSAHKENQLARSSMLNIIVNVDSILVRLHQDEYLLILFMVDELTECILSALSRVMPPPPSSNSLHDLASSLTNSGRGLRGVGNIKGGTTTTTTTTTTAAEELFKSAIDYSALPQSQSGGDGGLSVASVQINVRKTQMKLRCPRLSAEGGGKPVSEPLWMTLSYDQRRAINQDWAFHTYELEAYHLGIFVYNRSTTKDAHTLVNIRGESVDLYELLPNLPVFASEQFVAPATNGVVPEWARRVPLLQGFAALETKSAASVMAMRTDEGGNNTTTTTSSSTATGGTGGASTSSAPSSKKLLRVCVQRDVNHTAKTQDVRADVLLNHIAINHQAAHEGDHWLFVLMSFFSDAPVLNVSEDDTYSLYSEDIVAPYSTVTSVRITATEVLCEYQPFSMASKIVLLVPRLVVDTGNLVSNNPRATIKISLDKMNCFLNDNFPKELLAYDAEMGMSSVFGTSRSGISGDLELLGFVPILKLENTNLGSTPVIVLHIEELQDKPFQVEISGINAEFACAYDAFNLFQFICQHFFAGLDAAFLPSPYLLVGANGEQCLKVKPKARAPKGPTVKILPGVESKGLDDRQRVGEFMRRMQSALKTKFTFEEAMRKEKEHKAAAAAAKSPTSSPGGTTTTTTTSSEQQSVLTVEANFLSRGTQQQQQQQNQQGNSSASNNNSMMAGGSFSYITAGGGQTRIRHGSAMGSSEDSKVRPKSGKVLDGGSDHEDDVNNDDDDDDFVEITLEATPPPSAMRDISWRRYDPNLPPSISNCFQSANHFSVHNMASSGGSTSSSSHGRAVPLEGCPPIDVEILIFNVNVTVKFYGGNDFGMQVQSSQEYNTVLVFHDDFREQVSADGRRVLRPTRKQNAYVLGNFQGLFLQVDLFAPDKEKAMHMLCSLRDFEVQDRVGSSSVGTLLSCTVPRKSRDTDCSICEMKWVTVCPKIYGVESKPEEQVSFRCQPLWLCMHQDTFELLKPFFVPPETLPGSSADGPSTMFFNKFMLHPLDIAVSWYPSQTDVSALGRMIYQRNYLEFLNFCTIEGSRLKLSGVLIHNSSVEELGLNLLEAAQPQLLKTPNLLLMFCGLSPIRSASEAVGAVGDLILTPLESFKKRKSLYAGFMKGISSFGRRITGETFRVGAAATEVVHHGVHSLARPVQPQSHRDPLTRADQPNGINDGIQRGAHAITTGIAGMADSVTVCISGGGGDGTSTGGGSLLQIPLVALVPLDGMLRGMTEVLRGIRNYVRPDSRELELKQFKKESSGDGNGGGGGGK